MIRDLIKCDVAYTVQNNVYHFITCDTDRPRWSRALDDYFTKNPHHLRMKSRYKFHCNNIKTLPQKQKYLRYITELGGVTVDLASGPSGYFSPVFNVLKDDGIFVATDACNAVINGHQKAIKDKRFFLCDVNLDLGLPFEDRCIDTFCGNLLNNVDNYNGLIGEISRCLKPHGRFAVIENFYEVGSQTYDYLEKNGAVFSSLEKFIDVCNTFGLKYVSSEVSREIVGKLSGDDLLPINKSDKCIEMFVYLEKSP